MSQRLVLPVLSVLLVAALAGCASHLTRGIGGPVGAVPALSSERPTTTGAAPRVPSPLNTSAITTDACAALSATERGSLKLGDGRPRSTSNGPSCTFQEEQEPGNQIDVTTVTADKNGLSDVYDTKDNDAYFGETQVGGYPAVFAAAVDDRSNGKCGLFVAVTDQLAVNILVQYDEGPGQSDPCGVADKFGAAMIDTLK